jgi:hypothetical protein
MHDEQILARYERQGGYAAVFAYHLGAAGAPFQVRLTRGGVEHATRHSIREEAAARFAAAVEADLKSV